MAVGTAQLKRTAAATGHFFSFDLLSDKGCFGLMGNFRDIGSSLTNPVWLAGVCQNIPEAEVLSLALKILMLVVVQTRPFRTIRGPKPHPNARLGALNRTEADFRIKSDRANP